VPGFGLGYLSAVAGVFIRGLAFAGVREDKNQRHWIPACAGMTKTKDTGSRRGRGLEAFGEYRVRSWIPAFAGMTKEGAGMTKEGAGMTKDAGPRPAPCDDEWGRKSF